MSRNSGANGKIVSPKNKYNQFSKELVQKYQSMQKIDYQLFNTFLVSLLEKYKGKRNLDWNNIVHNEAYMHFLHNPHSHINKQNPFMSCSVYDLAFACIDFNNKTKRPILLKFKKIKPEQNRIQFDFDENYISLNKETHSLQIFVSYNNHSLEHAQENQFFKFVIEELRKINWTPSTGGEVYMTQEDDDSFGPGISSHIIYKFGNHIS